MTTADVTLARWLARKAVLEQCRAKGLRCWDLEAKDIHRSAETYLTGHPELWAEAHSLCAKLASAARRKRR
jgi:hypothetical protein